MSELRHSLEKLKITVKEILNVEPKFVSLQITGKVAKTLEEKNMQKDAGFEQKESAEQILAKIKRGEPLKKRDCTELPFVISILDLEHNLADKKALRACINYLDLSRERILKRLIFVYFMDYMHIETIKKTIIRGCIIKGLKNLEIKPSNMFMKNMKKYIKIIFTDACTQNISRVIDRYGLDGCTQMFALPELIGYSELIVASTEAYFTNENFLLSNKMKWLKEVMNNTKPFYAIFPKIADEIIKDINKSIDVEKGQYRDYCLDTFYEELGDPRFTRYAVRWNGVSDESRRVFLSWLAEKDLNLFFEIIEKTAVDRMWRYRKDFWGRYLPFITNTWVFFGRTAIRYADQVRHSRMSYGKLGKMCDPEHSVFAFQIGRYVFVEWSHNGKLRVWDIEDAPNVFGAVKLDKQDITAHICPPVVEWTHSSAETGNWQSKVFYWIATNCGVNPFN